MAESILAIHKLENCGVFCRVTNHPQFGQYNLIYGANGSGKSTFSRIFKSINDGAFVEALESYSSIKLQIRLENGDTVDGTSCEQLQGKIAVFNEDFITKTLNLDQANAEPLYYLGEEQGELLSEYNQAKDRVDGLSESLDEKKLELRRIQNEQDEKLRDRGRLISQTLGLRTFNKRHLEGLIGELENSDEPASACILSSSEEEEYLLIAQHGSNDKSYKEAFSFQTATVQGLSSSASSILQRNILYDAIDELEEDPDLRAWANKGFALHANKPDCAFCGSKITNERRERLNKYFNEAYSSLNEEVNSLNAELDEAISILKSIRLYNKDELYNDHRHDYEVQVASWYAVRSELINQIKRIQSLLSLKKSSPSQIPDCINDDTFSQACASFMAGQEGINQIIEKHNSDYEDFDTKRESAVLKMKQHYAATIIDEYKVRKRAISLLEQTVKAKTEELDHARIALKELDAKLQDHHLAESELNDLLRLFLGRQDIRLETQDKGYRITRYGETAKNLSEGEKTAIAFTYFVAKMREKNFDLTESIVVVDDPISSLDIHSLYSVGTFIRLHLAKAKQLFVLTHNQSFLREMHGFFNGSRNIDKKSYLTIACTKDQDGVRKSKIRKMDNVLMRYDGAYLFLFKELLGAHKTYERSAGDVSEDDLDVTIRIPNVARKVLETFLIFKFPGKHQGGALSIFNYAKDLNINFPREKLSSLDRLLNRGSHGDDKGMSEVNLFNRYEMPNVISSVLEFISCSDQIHYDNMIQACK